MHHCWNVSGDERHSRARQRLRLPGALLELGLHGHKSLVHPAAKALARRRLGEGAPALFARNLDRRIRPPGKSGHVFTPQLLGSNS
jgi:hypothetical protein